MSPANLNVLFFKKNLSQFCRLKKNPEVDKTASNVSIHTIVKRLANLVTWGSQVLKNSVLVSQVIFIIWIKILTCLKHVLALDKFLLVLGLGIHAHKYFYWYTCASSVLYTGNICSLRVLSRGPSLWGCSSLFLPSLEIHVYVTPGENEVSIEGTTFVTAIVKVTH